MSHHPSVECVLGFCLLIVLFKFLMDLIWFKPKKNIKKLQKELEGLAERVDPNPYIDIVKH